MTRAEAIELMEAYTGSKDSAAVLINVLVCLDVLKLDTPQSPQEKALEVLTDFWVTLNFSKTEMFASGQVNGRLTANSAGRIVDALNANGLILISRRGEE